MTALRPLHALTPVAFCALFATSPWAHAADGPLPMRQLAPDSTYILVAADAWNTSLDAWGQTGLHGLYQIEPFKGIFGSEGAQGNLEKHLKEIGAPEGSASWPDAFGMAVYLAHNNELDTDEAHTIFYGDWGPRADSFAQLIDAAIAHSVRKDGWKSESSDEIAGRKVTMITLPEDKEAEGMRQQLGGMGIEMPASSTTFYYTRDKSRFFVGTDRAGLEDALEVVDGSRTSTLPAVKEFQSTMDQLGPQAVSAVVLTGPMQKLLEGDGMGMLAMFQPIIQTLIGDVQALGLGVAMQGQRGQLEVTQTILAPGPRVGLWTLIGPAAPIDPPPPMFGQDSISYARVNIQFKEFMNLVNTVAANVPEVGGMLDPWLMNFGPVVSKGMEALGPGVWMASQVRQPVTPTSLVSSTIIACSNPNAVVPMLAQLAAPAGIEPRDVDGNTIFSSEDPPMAIGVSQGYVASGDVKQVEQAMRAVGQKGLTSVSENPAYKRAAASVGSEAVIAWGYQDNVARWAFDREMMMLADEDSAMLPSMVDGVDESMWADQLGYKLPDDAAKKLATLEPAVLAKYVGPLVWSVQMNDKGLVTRVWLLPAAPAPAE